MDERHDFDGIDVSGPWGGVRIGAGRGRSAGEGGDAEYRAVRRRVRRRLRFYRHAATYAFVVGGLALVDWLTGGGWWVQWLVAIWGSLLALQFFSTFVTPHPWGREVEERMVRREIECRRGSVHVTLPGAPPDERALASGGCACPYPRCTMRRGRSSRRADRASRQHSLGVASLPNS